LCASEADVPIVDTFILAQLVAAIANLFVEQHVLFLPPTATIVTSNIGLIESGVKILSKPLDHDIR
jgi:hypothetical protein